MALLRYKANQRGMRRLLGSEGVRGDLVRRAEQVAAVADAAYKAHPPHQGEFSVYVDSQAGTPDHPRARAAVVAQHPAAIPYEKHHHVLAAAMDAARL